MILSDFLKGLNPPERETNPSFSQEEDRDHKHSRRDESTYQNQSKFESFEAEQEQNQSEQQDQTPQNQHPSQRKFHQEERKRHRGDGGYDERRNSPSSGRKYRRDRYDPQKRSHHRRDYERRDRYREGAESRYTYREKQGQEEGNGEVQEIPTVTSESRKRFERRHHHPSSKPHHRNYGGFEEPNSYFPNRQDQEHSEYGEQSGDASFPLQSESTDSFPTYDSSQYDPMDHPIFKNYQNSLTAASQNWNTKYDPTTQPIPVLPSSGRSHITPRSEPKPDTRNKFRRLNPSLDDSIVEIPQLPPYKINSEAVRGEKSNGSVDASTLVIANIPKDLNTVEKLCGHFKQFGEVQHVEVDVPNSRAQIQFENAQVALKALRAPEAVLGNRFIKVFAANRYQEPGSMKGKSAGPPLSNKFNPVKKAAKKSHAPPSVSPSPPAFPSPAPFSSSTPSSTPSVPYSSPSKPPHPNAIKNVEIIKKMKQEEAEIIKKQLQLQQELLEKIGQTKNISPKEKAELIAQVNAIAVSISSSILKLKKDTKVATTVKPNKQLQPQAYQTWKLEKEKARLDRELEQLRQSTSLESGSHLPETGGSNEVVDSPSSVTSILPDPSASPAPAPTSAPATAPITASLTASAAPAPAIPLAPALDLEAPPTSTQLTTTAKNQPTSNSSTPPAKPSMAFLRQSLVNLKRQAAELGIDASRSRENQTHAGRGRGAIHSGSPAIMGKGRGRMTLDNRPTAILVSHVSSDMENAIFLHFKPFGEIVKKTYQNEEMYLQFANRRAAELAMTHGRTFKTKPLQLNWAPSVHQAVSNQTRVQSPVGVGQSELHQRNGEVEVEEVYSHPEEFNNTPPKVEGQLEEEEEEEKEGSERSWKR